MTARPLPAAEQAYRLGRQDAANGLGCRDSRAPGYENHYAAGFQFLEVGGDPEAARRGKGART